MHNGKYHTEQYKAKQRAKVDRKYGPVETHLFTCEGVGCQKNFTWEGRRKTKKYERASRFCSRSCANNRLTYWHKNATRYRTICFYHWGKRCQICGFDKVVAVHHIDEDHSNNVPHNLIPLCPNHHEMIHSKWRHEVQPQIDKLVIDKFTDPNHKLFIPGP